MSTKARARFPAADKLRPAFHPAEEWTKRPDAGLCDTQAFAMAADLHAAAASPA
jgi:hypothetical protein